MNTNEITSPLQASAPASSEAKNLTKKKPELSAVEELRQLREEQAAAIELKRLKDRELVRGKFIFHEVPGGEMGFMFRKYKKDPLEKHSMIDGQIYTVPRGVAHHLNTNCWYPSYTFKYDENKRPSTSIGEKIRRVSFQSLEFIED